MSTVVKVALGILLAIVILIAGCAVLIGGVASVDPGPGGEDTGLEDGVGGGGGSDEKRTPQKTRRFSGNGSKNIGTVKVTDDAVLKWTHSESGDIAFFTITDADFDINVSSDSRKGQSALEPGTYKNIDVSGTGDWTITIKGR